MKKNCAITKYKGLTKKKTIVIDIDGVVLQWNSMVIPFLISKKIVITQELRDNVLNNIFFSLNELNGHFKKGFLFEYHKSDYASEMVPMERGVAQSLRKLSEEYNLIALTSFSDYSIAVENRKKNLESYFPGIFNEVRILPTLHEKETELRKISKRTDIAYFIDDNPKHVAEGIKVLGEDRVIHFNNISWDEICLKILNANNLNLVA